MKSIPLSRGKFTIVDDEDFVWLTQWKWTYATAGYAYRKSKEKRCILMHRLITNAPNGLEVDHINGNKLDNRRENLRHCTRSQNMANRDSQGNVTGYRGVVKHVSGLYGARIYHKKQISLGYYKTATEAAKAYNVAAALLFGEFARLNDV